MSVATAIASATIGGAGLPIYNFPATRNVAGAIWLRGDSLTQASGLVTGWNDKFGNWPSATIIGTAPVPVASIAAYGGRPGVSITGSQRGLRVATFTVSQPSTIYVVADNSSTANTSLVDADTARQVIQRQAANWIYFAGSVVASTVTTTGPHAWCAVFSGASSHLYADDSGTPAASGNPGANALTSVTIGSTGVGNQISGNILEFIVLPGSDSLAQRQAMFAYFAQNYGLAVA